MKKIYFLFFIILLYDAGYCQTIDFSNNPNGNPIVLTSPISKSDFRISVDSTQVEWDETGLKISLRDTLSQLSIYADNISEPLYEDYNIPPGVHWFILEDEVIVYVLLNEVPHILIKK